MSTYELDVEETGLAEEVLPEWTKGSQNFGWWGMALLIATEAMIFGGLIATYWYLRFKHGPIWPPDGIPIPTLTLPLIMTAILWASSVPVHIADRGVRRGNQTALRVGLAVGFVLGATFLTLQGAIEYPDKLKEFSPTDGVYGSLFFALTGLHGAHVGIGLVISMWTQVRAWLGHFDEKRHMTVQNFAMYWHFVDTVWLFVLSTIYLSPNFI